MPTESLEVWVDVGGTFTDCLVRRTDAIGVSHRDAIKVLSSGLVSAQVISWDDHQRLATLQLPAPYAIEGFWNSANLVLASDNHSVRITSCEKLARDQIRVALDERTSRGWNAGEACTLDANIESPVLATRVLLQRPLNEPLPPLSVRMGTTRGTNALLTRTGAPTALLITEGFADLLAIGTQDRPDLFALDIVKPTPLATHTVEVPGRLDADGDELLPLDEDVLRQRLSQLKADANAGIVLAICLMHSYRNDVHERRVQTIAQEIGFANVLCSSDVVSLPRIVPRAETTTLDAYLQPILEAYVQRVWKQFGGADSCHLRWMTSNGNLVASPGFRGKDSVLSGPAGGVVALADVARQCNVTGAVGLDMGGTSTDVSRYDGQVGKRQESNIGGIRVLTPMMDIHTIASGGGSICEVRDGRLHVGPDSAGAFPGPACYGNGGPLTVTDINVLLGRLPVDRFPFPLDLEASRRVLNEVHSRLPRESTLTPEGLADGFLQLAVTQIAEAVRVVTTAAGSDARQMALVGFGGAAGGHLCQVADALEMTHVIDHPDAGLLSAVGMGAAKIGRIHVESIQQTIATACSTDNRTFDRVPDKAALQRLAVAASRTQQRCEDELQRDEKISRSAKLEIQHQCEVRPVGTQSSLSVDLFPLESLPERFDQKHLQTFGYVRETMPIETVTVRCEVAVFSRDDRHSQNQRDSTSATSASLDSSSTLETTKMWVDGVDTEVELWDRDKLQSGQTIRGPSIIAGPYSVLVVEPSWQANLSDNGILQLRKPKSATKTTDGQQSTVSQSSHWNDIVAMEIAARRVQGIAEAMGEVIRRTSVSVNVKERRDYSCAVFLGDGSLVANAPHVPVHLGAMSHTVRSLIAEYPQMSAGDSYISNDPFAGGSHLPDLTVVTPVFCTDTSDRPNTSLDAHRSERPDGWPCDFFVASRCHHAEIGGIVPGSMAPAATCLAEEGVVLHNECLVRSGQPFHENIRKLLSEAAYPSRNVEENMADIAAAEAAGQSGARRIQALAEGMGKNQLLSWLQQLLHVAGEATATWIQTLGSESRTFEDSLDDGTPIRVTLTPDQSTGRLRIDFTGTGPVHPNGFNATRSIVTAAVLYVLRCVSPGELPLCDGVLQRIELIIPPGLLAPTAGSSPENSPAVVAGNVETSNRVVDVLLGCLGVAAASQGTMNNLLLGDETFGYYETIGGGAGATSNRDGADAVHTHMTNTRITDPEILESRLPVRLWRFAIRPQSGGAGRHRGGNGIIREFEFLRPLTLSLITSRRETKPYGMDGGEPGKPGQQTLIRDNTETSLPFATTQTVSPGDRLILETPGGGGYGTPIDHSSPGSTSSSSSPNSESASS